MVCLLSAGYILFAVVSPAFKRRRSRRDYQTIGDAEVVSGTTIPGAGGSRATTTGAATARDGSSSVQAGGALGGPGENRGPLGVDDVVGGGWRPYGSTDEAPAAAGCLPPSDR